MENSEMTYTHELKDGIALFHLEGSLLAEVDRTSIKNDFTEYLEQDVNKFLIDLSKLRHINSTGLGIFITLYTKVRGKGGEMVICSPSQNISNLLAITKLNSVFNIVDTELAGLERLQSI
ncbi:MAG: STAS domain-containing protein [Bacteroidetes bacterium]|jgi:anti-sigma B factor antagonist|nr:STAS domain-containing protein [Bacteroidota bacterium]